LWYVYLSFTVACAASYMLAGMSWFDALCHSFSTVAIGGFSTHDLSMGYFNSTAIELVAIVFMFAAGINFSLHFFAWRYVSIKHYAQDPEFRGYFAILIGVSVLVIFGLFRHQVFDSPGQTIVTGLFQAVSIATTTGFTTADYAAWPAAVPVLLIFASFIGGSAGSTAGGIKVVRWLLIYKQGVREITRLVHPSAEIPVKLGNKAVGYRVVDAVWGFFSVYVVVFSAMLVAMMTTGLDQVTAFSAVAATLNNLGPGLGDVSSGFMTLTDPAKWIAIAGMLLGRLEIFTLRPRSGDAKTPCRTNHRT
jgi:trk system potassium uptake protein TrkH